MKNATFLFLILLISFTGSGQFKNIMLDSGTVGQKRRPSEPSIAINPKDPMNMVVGAIPNKVYHTVDGWYRWSLSSLESSHGVFGDPVVLSDHKGKFYYYHLADPTEKNFASEEFLSGIVVQESTDNGKTWTNGELIGDNPTKDHDKPWGAIDRKNNLYLTWTEFDKYGNDDPTCSSRILFSKSSNGTRWSKPVTISQLDGDCKDDDNTPMGAVPVVNSDGLLFVTWSNQNKIFMDRSFDGGTTWLTNDLIVAEQVGGWNFDIPGLKRCNGLPMLVTDNGPKSKFRSILYLVWADQRNGVDNTDVWFSRSMNYGDNWTSPMRIGNDEKHKHQFFPSITVDDSGNIYIVYYDRSAYEDNQTDVMLSYSTDGGASFKSVKVSETPFTPTTDAFLGDYINVAASKGVVAPVWTRVDNGITSIWVSVINHKDLPSNK